MPALDALAPSNTELPGLARRRVWSCPALKSHSVAVLTLRRLHLAPFAGEPKPEVLAAIDKGIDLDKVLGPLTTIIDLSAVRRVKLDLVTNSLAIEYAAARVTVVFAASDEADAFFSKLWRRLGETYQLQPYKKSAWRAARGPVLALVGVLAATALLVFGANVADDLATARLAQGGARSAVESALGWLSWEGVCAAGGAAAAATQVWLYRRLTQPPIRLELVRK